MKLTKQAMSLTPLAAGIALATASSLSHALSFEFDNGWTADWDTTVKYGAAWRTQDQSTYGLTKRANSLIVDIPTAPTTACFGVAVGQRCKLDGWQNGDDGNRAFDEGALISNQVSFISELDLNNGDGAGAFMRIRGFYDDAYQGKTDNKDQDWVPGNNTWYNQMASSSSDRFTDKTRDINGHDFELLDAFVYAGFELGDLYGNIRVGRQVVSWGESLFMAGGVATSQTTLDVTKLSTPGVELKDVFLPVGQVYGQIDLTENISLEAYVQWEWENHRLPGVGSYWSPTDLLDNPNEGGDRWIFAPSSGGLPVDHGKDDVADDDGQWGMAIRYIAEDLNDAEFSFYFVNYHEKTPLIFVDVDSGIGVNDYAQVTGSTRTAQAIAAGAGAAAIGQAMAGDATDQSTYFGRYLEDVRLYGLSVSTVIGETNVAAELTYRENAPVRTDVASAFCYTAGACAGGASFSGLLGGQFGADLSKEHVGYQRAEVTQLNVSAIHIFGETFFADNVTYVGEFAYNRTGSGLKDEDLYEAKKDAFGHASRLTLEYFNVLPGLDLKVPLIYRQSNENAGMAGSISRGGNSWSVAADFTYLSNFQFGAQFVEYFGDAEHHIFTDRDFVSINASYSF